MRPTTKSEKRTKSLFNDDLGEIRKNIASAMIGRTVSLLADAKTIAHGMVAGVMVEAGMPKIVVNGQSYELGRVLTVTTGLN